SFPGSALVQIGSSRGGRRGWSRARLESRRQDRPGGGRSRRRIEQAEELPSLHVVFNGAILRCDAGWSRRGNEPQLLGCGLEKHAQELGVRSPGFGQASLPATDQVAGSTNLPFPDLDTEFHELWDHVLLRPTALPALGPQTFIFLDFQTHYFQDKGL